LFLLGYCFYLIVYYYAYKLYVADWRSFGCEPGFYVKFAKCSNYDNCMYYLCERWRI